eukprot:scaffold3226_cov160-Amphora_coffeaeformis.AAC.26
MLLILTASTATTEEIATANAEYNSSGDYRIYHSGCTNSATNATTTMPILGRKVDRKRSGRTVPRTFKQPKSDDSSEEDEGDTKPAALDNNNEEDATNPVGKNSVRSDDEDKLSTGDESFQDDDDDEDFSVGKVESDEDDSEDDESAFSAEPPKHASARSRNTRRRPRAAAPATNKKSRAVARKSRGRLKKNESSDEEEFQQEDESSEEGEAMGEEESSEDEGARRNPRGRKSTSRAATSRAGRRKAKSRTPSSKSASRPNRRKKDESEDEEEFGREESSEEEVVILSNKRRRVEPKTRVPKRGRTRSKNESSDESEGEDSESDNSSNLRTPKRRPRENIPSSTGSRSKRASAQKAIAALADFNDDEEEEEDYVIPKSFRKNNKDDEDFEDKGDEEESEEELELEEDDLQNNALEREEGNVGLVNDDDIGSAEESEDDTTRPHQSPQLSLQHQSPSRAGKYNASYDSDEDSEDDRKQPAFSPTMPTCPSKRDAITDEDLPIKHVCFFSPDGRNRQCFALETLHKIATSTVCEQIRQDLTGRVVQAFLQPPHFRSAMSDDLLDQIASRFGRDALDLHGDYYKRKKEQHNQVLQVDESEDDEDDDRPLLRASHNFVEQVQNYVRSQMGSRDLYVCPLCFVYARRKYNMTGADEPDPDADAEETDDALHELYLEKDGSDPMEVLGHLDMSYSDSFLTASSFCFSKVAAVKLHLRKDHGVSTNNIEGNDLYARFKMRTTDGLLQRFLKTRIGHVNQGEMQRYWFTGNNFDFVYLCSLVDEAGARAQNGADVSNEDRKEAETFVERSKNFFDSFETLAMRLWDLIKDPFRRTTENEELNGFLADDDAEDDVADSNIAHRQLDLKMGRENVEALTQEERERIARYQREEGVDIDLDEVDDCHEEDDLQDTDDDAEEENAGVENKYTSSSEEDEWVGAIHRKRKAKSPQQNKSRRRQSRTGFGATADETLPEEEEGIDSPLVSPSSRKRLVIREDEEE